ncbi:MAG: histidine kinase dimerization/phosphoacceptor domain -containing protein, partial [Bacteroidota bacterium]
DYTVFAVEGDDHGNIWIGSYEGGLSRLDPKTGQFKHILNDDDNHPLPANYISDILEKDGILWLGTANGIANYNTKTKEIKSFPRVFEKIDFSDDIKVLRLQNDQFLWAGSNKGLFRFNTQTQVIDSTKTVLDSLEIGAIAFTEDYMWVGTREGLIQYDDENGVKWFRTADGLSNDNVLGLEVDLNGNIWCITSGGLNAFDPKSATFINFYYQDGLAGNQFNNGSVYQGQNGMFYAGGLKGFTSWNPQQVTLHNNEPSVVFTDLFNKKEDKEIHTSLINVSEIVLNDDDDFISVHFFSDEIIEKSKTRFAYRIRELNSKNWIEINNWKVDLIDLRPGDYTLDVKAANYDGLWGNHSTLQVSVLPPIWNTNYAYAFYGLVAISLVFLRDRYLKSQRKKLERTVEDRTKEIRKQKEIVERDKATIDDQNKVIAKSLAERESLLKEIHHRVKNNLQIIASLLYLQSGKFEDEDYKKVLEEGQGRVRSMALIHQKLYENEDLKSIPFEEYLTELVGEIRASFGQPMAKIDLNIEAANIYFDVDTAVPLGLIVNELATNAFKYAFSNQEKGSFSIFLKEDQGNYSLHIKDDGKGLPEEIDLRKAKSLGLRLVRMLSQQLEGDFRISGKDGTSFELKFAA